VRGVPTVFLLLGLGGCGGEDGAGSGPSEDAAAPSEGGADGPCAAEPTEPDQRRYERGWVRGVLDDESLSFLGLRYAEPPLGDRRWRPPEPLTGCVDEVVDATTWGPACVQLVQSQREPFSPDNPLEGEEDCLTLNLFMPAAAGPDARLPVLVFIHGGGNTIGSAGARGGNGDRIYDGRSLALRGPAVVVTLQYRLGPFGYLVHPALDAESPRGASGNYGLLDQLAALEWVQRNIAGFGGDPDRVLLFGESAGAVNTCIHVASPRSAGTFSRALMQSGACTSPRPLDQKRSEGEAFVAETPCAASTEDPAGCLRGLDAETVIRAGAAPITVGPSLPPPFEWGPVIDGWLIPERPLEALAAGRMNSVPIVVGANTEETSLSVGAVPDEAAYRQRLEALVGPTVTDAILERYPVERYGTPRDALVQAFTDASFGCAARWTARAAAPHVPVYRYLFAQSLEGSSAQAALGAFHGVELGFVFGSVGGGTRALTADERATVDQMQRQWLAFARDGRPEAVWPRYGPAEPLLELDATPEVIEGWRNDECDFWDGLLGIRLDPPADG
jgi:para-nitrobenzyl esterase